MLLGHLTTTYVGRDVLKKLNIHINLPLLLVSALIPDLIDKPLAILINAYPGRAIGHSALFHILICCILLRLLPSHKKSILTVAGGCFLHLLQDWVSLQVLLWPFLGAWNFYSPLSFGDKIHRYYIQIFFPIAWTLEILSFLYILFPYLPRFKKVAEQTAEEGT